MISEPDQPLIEFLSDMLGKDWPLDPELIVVKPEGDNRWQILDKVEADKLGVTGKSIKQQLNIDMPSDRIDLKRVISSIQTGRKNRDGTRWNDSGFQEGQRSFSKMSNEHEEERKEHDDFMGNENQVTARNRDVKQFKRDLDKADKEDEHKFRQKRNRVDKFTEEVELSPDAKERKMKDMRKKFDDKRDSRRKPFVKTQKKRQNRNQDDWLDIDDDDGDDD